MACERGRFRRRPQNALFFLQCNDYFVPVPPSRPFRFFFELPLDEDEALFSLLFHRINISPASVVVEPTLLLFPLLPVRPG